MFARNKIYLTVHFFTGVRTGEVHGLKWKHVDFVERTHPASGALSRSKQGGLPGFSWSSLMRACYINECVRSWLWGIRLLQRLLVIFPRKFIPLGDEDRPCRLAAFSPGVRGCRTETWWDPRHATQRVPSPNPYGHRCERRRTYPCSARSQ